MPALLCSKGMLPGSSGNRSPQKAANCESSGGESSGGQSKGESSGESSIESSGESSVSQLVALALATCIL